MEQGWLPVDGRWVYNVLRGTGRVIRALDRVRDVCRLASAVSHPNHRDPGGFQSGRAAADHRHIFSPPRE